MTINYTTLLGLAKPVTGTESGAWGDVVNDQITSLVEDSIANAASINVTSGNVTLTDNNGTSDQARMAILLVSGTPGTSRNIVAPSTSKWYIVRNGSNDAVVIKGSATTGVTIPTGSEALVFWNGSDFEVGGMAGPTSSTDNAVVRYDGTTGKLVQNSSVTIDDSNNVGGLANLNFSGTGNRITGDFSNATAASRVMFQTSTTNGNTLVATLPNGTSNISGFQVYANSSGITDVPFGQLAAFSTEVAVSSARNGTGVYLPLTFYTGGSERVRVDTSGNVGIGTTGATGPLSVKTDTDFVIAMRTTAASTGARIVALNLAENAYKDLVVDGTTVQIATGGSERVHIDSSGNLLVGTTSSAEGSGVGLKLLPSATGPRYAVVGSDSSNTTIAIGVYSTGAAAYRFQVGYGGTIYATSTSISAISDQTLKENIRDLETGLREVMSLKPRRFDWINGDAKNVAGFVAQEVEQVLPELVEDYVYNKDNEGNSIIKKSLKMGDILPTLVKAIQEQQVIIEQLTQRIAALEQA
jgi:Chaperone of endosialidase